MVLRCSNKIDLQTACVQFPGRIPLWPPHRRNALIEWLKLAELVAVNVVATASDDKLDSLYTVEILNYKEETTDAAATESAATAESSVPEGSAEAPSCAVVEATSVDAAAGGIPDPAPASAPFPPATATLPVSSNPLPSVSALPAIAAKSAPSSSIPPVPKTPPRSTPNSEAASAVGFVTETPTNALCCGCEDLDQIYLHSERFDRLGMIARTKGGSGWLVNGYGEGGCYLAGPWVGGAREGN